MSEEGKFSLSVIIKKLCGEIQPYGDAAIDDKRYNNIQNYYEVLSFVIAKLENASKDRNCIEYSRKK